MTACDPCLRRAWLLSALSEHLARASARHGALDALLACEDGDLMEALHAPSRTRDAWAAFDARRLRRAAAEAALATTCPHAADGFPAALRELPAPPRALFVRNPGRLAHLAAQPCVAIVGARRASAYGLEIARALARDLAVAGVPVVSGMALGIDSAAHAGALEGCGLSAAVLAGGADVSYPRAKRQLHARLARDGILLSEMPPAARPSRWGFPARNRLIAALASLTVVVEAAGRSGALITARVARELGREVGAIPGRVTSPLAAGTNALIRDGAHLIDGPQSVLDVLFGVGARHVADRRAEHTLDAGLGTLLERVRSGSETVAALGGDAGDTLAGLAELELHGLVRRTPGGRYIPAQ